MVGSFTYNLSPVTGTIDIAQDTSENLGLWWCGE